VLKSSKDPAIQIVREPDGQMATSIRLLGTKIEEYARTLGYRAYMLTSAEPLCGKTTTIMNLAFALAEDTHRRVALVEANFRFPRFSEILGLPEREGIIPVLEGRAKLHESVVKVKDRNLVVLPTGGRHPHPAEVLASPRFKTMIAELADTVDIAVIDAPAVSPHADANLLLPLVDAVFLVVANHDTKGVYVTRALTQLGEKRVLGALYNHIPKKKLKELKVERSQRLKQK
jgi:capsular exopolysaccharide synthesis family protein